MPPQSSDDALPPGRVVRWMLLAGIVLFSVGLFFRYGRDIAPLGTEPASATTTTPPATR